MGPDDPTGLPPDETYVEEELVDPNEPHCHRCGAPHDRFQEYCLECGARLTPLPHQLRRTTWSTAGSPLWFWASLIALSVIALITAAVVIAASDDEKSGATSSSAQLSTGATGLTTISLPSTTFGSVPVLPPTTTFTTTGFTTTGFTTTAQTTTAQTTTGTTTDSSGLTKWPSGKTGYTIILESVPQSQGRTAAENKAKAAQSKGLTQVGVLNTNEYQGLTADFYAVFSGVKDTQAEAEAGVAQAKTAGYPHAYVRKIVPN
jgi:hypothetical protein